MIGHHHPARPLTYDRGLAGLVAGDTAISHIDGKAGHLWYRGYSVDDLAAHASFEEVSHLILQGELPRRDQLTDWTRELASWRELPSEAVRAPRCLPDAYDVLSAFRTSVAVAASLTRAPQASDGSEESSMRTAARILTWNAGLAAAAIRGFRKHEPIPPRPDLGFAEHFLWLLHGREPDPAEARAFEVSLIVKAEHGIHAAALAALTVMSAGADLYSAVLAGIGAMTGTLHGGANRPAFEMIRGRSGPRDAREWVRQRIAEKFRFPGFGHRVYKAPDPRARLLAPHARRLLARSGQTQFWTIFETIREEVEAALGPRGIHANVDAITGLIYHAIDLPVEAFVIPFCLAIQTGWMAHCIEYMPDGALIEPGAIYIGPDPDTLGLGVPS